MSRGRLVLVAVVLVALCVASYLVVDRYGELAYIPELVSGFAATLIAFVLALEFEARRENRALARAEAQTNDARVTEARKRLLAVRTELGKNEESIGQIEAGLRSQAEMAGSIWRILHPQLLDGAWAASGERLGDLLADYELVSDVAVFYGRLEELRWRIRYRTQVQSGQLDGMTQALAKEMQGEVAGLLERITNEERDPGVRGVTHIGRLAGPVQLTPEGRRHFEQMLGEGGSGG